MTLRAIRVCRLGKGLFAVMASPATRFLRVILLVHLEIALFHLEDLGMAFITLHFRMRFMAENDRVRSLRGIGYVPAPHLLGLDAGCRKAKKTQNRQHND